MIILFFIFAALVGSALVNLGWLPNMWEWWAVIGYGIVSLLAGFDLGARQAKKPKEETPNAE